MKQNLIALQQIRSVTTSSFLLWKPGYIHSRTPSKQNGKSRTQWRNWFGSVSNLGSVVMVPPFLHRFWILPNNSSVSHSIQRKDCYHRQATWIPSLDGLQITVSLNLKTQCCREIVAGRRRTMVSTSLLIVSLVIRPIVTRQSWPMLLSPLKKQSFIGLMRPLQRSYVVYYRRI